MVDAKWCRPPFSFGTHRVDIKPELEGRWAEAHAATKAEASKKTTSRYRNAIVVNLPSHWEGHRDSDGEGCDSELASRRCNINAPALPARSSRPSQREGEAKKKRSPASWYVLLTPLPQRLAQVAERFQAMMSSRMVSMVVVGFSPMVSQRRLTLGTRRWTSSKSSL